MDSLKFYLSLYGHKLPVMCIDISSDGELIVTGSQDKNLKIWGLDFGDCHKSIFAHGDRYFQNSYRISKNGIKSTQSCGLNFFSNNLFGYILIVYRENFVDLVIFFFSK